MNQVIADELSTFAGGQAARQRTGAAAVSFPMNHNPLSIWQLHSENDGAPFMDGIDRAMMKAFPPVEGEFPERIALALQALEAAMGDRLSSRLGSRCGSGGTPRSAAHIHWNLMPPMADMIDAAFLPHSVRHGLRHSSEAGLRP